MGTTEGSARLGQAGGDRYSSTGKSGGRFNSIWRREIDGAWRGVFDESS